MPKVIASILTVVLILFYADPAMNQQLKIGENLRHERVLLPSTIPERTQMTVLDHVMFLEEGGAAGILIYYDDVRTRWEIDYIEFYDVDGELLLVTWIDRFGACHVAMDRGLLDATFPSVDGMLVVIEIGRFL